MRLITTKKFDKQFRKQPKKIQKEFVKRIELFLIDMYSPTLGVHKLSGQMKDLWSFSLSGDVRVIFDRINGNVAVLVAVGSHGELYS